MGRYMTEPAYEGMKLAQEDKTKDRRPKLKQIKERKQLKKLRKKRRKGGEYGYL